MIGGEYSLTCGHWVRVRPVVVTASPTAKTHPVPIFAVDPSMRKESAAAELEATSHPLRLSSVEPATVTAPGAVGERARMQAFDFCVSRTTARALIVRASLVRIEEKSRGCVSATMTSMLSL